MGLIVTRNQPQGIVRINWDNPITKGLVFAWVPSCGPIDVVSGKAGTPSGSALASGGSNGRISRIANGSGSFNWANRADLKFNGAPGQTLFAEIFITDSAAVTGAPFGRVVSEHDYRMFVDGASQTIGFSTGGNSGSVTNFPGGAGGLVPYANRVLPCVNTYDLTTSRLYLDGKLKASGAQSNGFSTSSDGFALFARGNGGSNNANGVNMSAAMIFRRCLSAEEVAFLSLNPWCVFEETTTARRFFSSVGAGGDATANPGGVSAASAIGTVAPTGNATATAAGLAATSAIGDVNASASVDGTATVTGVSAAGAIGAISATGSSSVTPPGVSAAFALGTVTATGASTATIACNESSSSIGTIASTGAATATPSSVEAIGAVGFVAATGVNGGDAIATMAGVGAASAIGDVISTGGAMATITGVSATSAIGTIRQPRAAEDAGAGGDDPDEDLEDFRVFYKRLEEKYKKKPAAPKPAEQTQADPIVDTAPEQVHEQAPEFDPALGLVDLDTPTKPIPQATVTPSPQAAAPTAPAVPAKPAPAAAPIVREEADTSSAVAASKPDITETIDLDDDEEAFALILEHI